MEELQEARKADRQSIKESIKDKKSKKPDKRCEDRDCHKQDRDKGERKVLVDQGSSADILFYSTLGKMHHDEASLPPTMETSPASRENESVSEATSGSQ
ncbi:hypothetical protein Cni_G10000 [Canna indica]|uniref:Uncharacterized protein n=1 Tax=Canna indica TaxID=4628 RepID=A0AAQ3K3E8_9LILI|nr:hypothetical protein Cni_G10000 [Canna indica]